MDFENNPKINEYREVVKKKVEAMNMPKLVYICGIELLKSATGLSSDLLHPSESGMGEIAMNLSSIMKKYMNLV